MTTPQSALDEKALAGFLESLIGFPSAPGLTTFSCMDDASAVTALDWTPPLTWLSTWPTSATVSASFMIFLMVDPSGAVARLPTISGALPVMALVMLVC
eukprot:CAMPEP_0198471104 /NCGR_PEP_ID=MMETSP1456-20131121/21761_1 /TAXON_ID=1461544 ORGANISM="Unidentified sp., Strain RCC1871" /NCGR_SAMPLE_ID=MMETSP1456 /ASSEMBLY_ACC=CAM_ASM_001119 /LENGTH=98 /DNA_ID=CAMNT_0044197653 /DNA_START=206 /DNA_END=499 /DNA_ORIENTATION=-